MNCPNPKPNHCRHATFKRKFGGGKEGCWMVGRANAKTYWDILINNITQPSTNASNKLVALQPQTITRHPDSGASGTYLMRSSNLLEQPATMLQVGCPNRQQMQSTTIMQLKIPNVPANANSARVFPALTLGNLLSIGQLCGNDYTAHFSKTKVTIKNNNNKVVLEGPHDKWIKLCKIDAPIATPTTIPKNPPTAPPLPQANGIIWKKTTMSELAIYHNTSLGALPPSLVLKAIEKGYLSTFSSLTKELIQKYLPQSIETAQGHLDQQRQHLQSTVPQPEPEPDLLQEPAAKTNEIMATVLKQTSHCQGASFRDLTGRCPVPSSQRNQYVLVVYHYDANAILAKPLRSRKKEGDILNRLLQRGHQYHLQRCRQRRRGHRYHLRRCQQLRRGHRYQQRWYDLQRCRLLQQGRCYYLQRCQHIIINRNSLSNLT